MTLDQLRSICLSLPGASEHVQWGTDLVFKVGGSAAGEQAKKMFAVAATEVAPVKLSFKCSDENFAELIERDGVIPAPYLARAKWVALETWDAIPRRELEALLRESYALVVAKLTRKERDGLGVASPPAKLSGNDGRTRRGGKAK